MYISLFDELTVNSVTVRPIVIPVGTINFWSSIRINTIFLNIFFEKNRFISIINV